MKTKMRFFTHVLTLMLMGAMVLASCSKKADEALIVPSNATYVMHIDLASLWQKGDLEHADQLQLVSSWRQELKHSMPALDEMVGAMLKDPSKCGLDFRQQVCLFTDMNDEVRQRGDGHFVAIVAMKSRSDFGKFLKDLEANAGLNIDLEEEDGQTIVELGGDAMMLFNDERLYVAYDMMRNEDLDDFLEHLVALKPEESMAKNKSFKKYLAMRKDLNIYYGFDKLFGGGLMMGDLFEGFSQETMKQLSQCAYGVFGSFEKGRVVMDFQTYNMPEEMKKMTDKRFNEDLLDYMPEETLVAGTWACDAEEMAEYVLKFLGDDAPSLEDSLGVKDYTMRDFVKAFGGSFAINFHGMRNGNILLSLAVDLENATVLRYDMAKEGFTADTNGIYEMGQQIVMPVKCYIGEDVAVLTTDEEVALRAAQGQKSQGLKAVAKAARKGHYFYLNLDQEAWPQELLQGLGLANNPMASLLLGMMDRMEIERNDVESQRASLYLSSDKENSLAYILHTIDQLN